MKIICHNNTNNSPGITDNSQYTMSLVPLLSIVDSSCRCVRHEVWVVSKKWLASCQITHLFPYKILWSKRKLWLVSVLATFLAVGSLLFFYQSHPIMESFPCYCSKSLYMCVYACVRMRRVYVWERKRVCMHVFVWERQTGRQKMKALKKPTF